MDVALLLPGASRGIPQSPRLWVLSVVVFSVFLVVLFLVRLLQSKMGSPYEPLREQLTAHLRGDYEAQLRIIETSTGLRSATIHSLRGMTLLQLGRLEEAAQSLSDALEIQSNSMLRVTARDQLGRVYMAQRRWSDARACFQQCLTEAPKRGGSHRAMAELLLTMDEQPATALEDARKAAEADRREKPSRDPFYRNGAAYRLALSLAVFAWALARNHGDRSGIESALNEAFSLCGEDAKPYRGALHYFAGQAFAALGSVSESSRQFRLARESDPNGLYGRLSHSLAAAMRS